MKLQIAIVPSVQTFEMYSALSVAECDRRLQAAIDYEVKWIPSLNTFFGGKRVAGRVHNRKLSLRCRREFTNPFGQCLVGRMEEYGLGTSISGRISIWPLMNILFWLWLGATLVIGGILIVASMYEVWAHRPESVIHAIIVMSGFVLLLVAGMAFRALCQRGFARERAELLEFLQATTDARIPSDTDSENSKKKDPAPETRTLP